MCLFGLLPAIPIAEMLNCVIVHKNYDNLGSMVKRKHQEVDFFYFI